LRRAPCPRGLGRRTDASPRQAVPVACSPMRTLAPRVLRRKAASRSSSTRALRGRRNGPGCRACASQVGTPPPCSGGRSVRDPSRAYQAPRRKTTLPSAEAQVRLSSRDQRSLRLTCLLRAGSSGRAAPAGSGSPEQTLQVAPPQPEDGGPAVRAVVGVLG